jgi:hypothetical protein
MDSFRHFLAVLELVVLPPGTCFWLVIHPYARWWRKVGALRTYLALVPVGGKFLIPRESASSLVDTM